MSKDLTGLYGCFTDKTTYNQQEIQDRIKKWVDKNQNIKSPMNKPTSIEVGDVILFHIASMFHPCVVFKKTVDKKCYGLVISSKDHDHHFLTKIENSRLYIKSYFTITVISVTEQQALDNFVGIFDSPKELKQAVKLLKTKYKDIL